MQANTLLHKASGKKKDEFYTQLSDIEKELRYYKAHFYGKVVYCNCDDPRASNFFKYFSMNFKALGLKRLITTCYKNQTPDLFSQNGQKRSIYLEYSGTDNETGVPKDTDTRVHYLSGDGDFRSNECIELLEQSDIVVTNPPFSLFKEYVAQLMEYRKKFLILGDQNAVTYQEVFPLIKDNRMWLGFDNGGIKWFQVPMDYDIMTESRKKIVNGTKYFSMGRICWFTNLDHQKRHEEIILYKRYTPEEYPQYDNFDAINVDRIQEIPVDWSGLMGVPVTFLTKYNPDQFEIMGIDEDFLSHHTGGASSRFYVDGKRKYARIVIRNRRF